MSISLKFLALSVLLTIPAGLIGQDSQEALPKVLEHAEPQYPAIARAAHVEGEVRVRIVTNGESVTEAQVESGPPVLRKMTEDNVRTWKFAPHTPGTFHVTFRYKLFFPPEVEVKFLQTPDFVDVEAQPEVATIGDYTGVDLGRWRVYSKGAAEKSLEFLELTMLGPNLDGKAVDFRGERTDLDFGYFDNSDAMLAFAVKLKRPDGHPLKAFFVGQWTKDRIAGTFVDDAGASGSWTAVQISKTHNWQ
jgi:TonB family protein